MTLEVTLDTITNPVDNAFVTIAECSGTTDNDLNVVTVSVTDELGNAVSDVPTASAGAWSSSFDLTALEDGFLIWQAVAVDAGGFSTTAVKVGEKAIDTLTSTAYSAVNQPWASHLDVRRNYQADGITTVQMDQACLVASDMLFLLTGQAWPGVGTDYIRPHAQWRQYDKPGWWQQVQGLPSARYGYCSCNRPRSTGCFLVPEIRLPRPHVDGASVLVKLDGVVYDAASGLHRVDDGRWLVRLDGSGWPCCQNEVADDSQPNTFSVRYNWGIKPDVGGVRAAAALAYELALLFSDQRQKCALPKRITHMTRGQTSIAVLDPLTLFKDGLTGLTEVDLWIASKMLGTARRGASVTRAGQGRSVRRPPIPT